MRSGVVDGKNVKNLKNRKGQKSSSKNMKILVSLLVCVAYRLPAPDTTALVTLRDKPQGENDSMPHVQVRSRKKVLVVLQKKVVPDTTALVTLRDKNLGGNDSMPSVHVRHHYVLNSNHHESCFKHIAGSEFTTDYNWYGTLSFVTEHRATHSQYRHTGYKFKIYCKRYNISSTISDFTSAWSLYKYNNLIQSIIRSEVTTDYSLNRHTGSEFKIKCDRYYFFLSYVILIPREPLLNILIVQTAGTVLFLLKLLLFTA